MARLPTPGSDDGTWGQVLNDFLATAHDSDGSIKANAVDSSAIQDNSVSGTKLQDSTITAAKLNVSGGSNGQVLTKNSALGGGIEWTSAAGSPDATTSSKGIVQLSGDLGGTAASPTVPGLAGKEPTITAGTTSEYFRGDKTFQTLDKAAVGLANVDNTSDANKPVSTAQQTALNLKADKSTTISAGTGLTGGGDLSTNRTLTVSYGTTSGTAAQGNDSRITGAEQTANKAAANGYASLDSSTKVPIAQLPTGTTSSTVAVGNDSRIVNAEQTTNKGAAGGYASLDGSTKVPFAQLPTGTSGSTVAVGNHTHTLTFSLTSFFKTGTLTTTTGTQRLPIDGTYTIVGTRLMVGTAPTGADLIVDINKNGTTIYTTQANRPTIVASSNAGGPGSTPDVTSLAAGDYLTVDIDQVGSTVAGSDLTVSVIVSKTV